MIPRYADDQISRIWSDKNKLEKWQSTELAVVQARANLSIIDPAISREMSDILESQSIDIAWWLAKDAEISHDLNAFVQERLRFLPPELQCHFHDDMTSYDTEEPAFATTLEESLQQVIGFYHKIRDVLIAMAKRYRHTIMMGKTHGQAAELQTFGKRCLTWLKVLNDVSFHNLSHAQEYLNYSKLSGAIGNYGGMDPKIEKEALKILGFDPFFGATQIMPRELYVPLAQALCQVVQTLAKIALDIRLGGRSGRPIYQEPFGKNQTGSSRMPHKKNTINTENVCGMERVAEGFFHMILRNVSTWEERSIEQSCVERIAWPSLFHVVVRCLKTMTRVLEGLVVYPDNMLLEVVDSFGTYAAGEAKEFLRHEGVAVGLTSTDAYKIVQLAAFNAFESSRLPEHFGGFCNSLEEAGSHLSVLALQNPQRTDSIRYIIAESRLCVCGQLGATQDDVSRWNMALARIFRNRSTVASDAWDSLFSPAYLLRNEAELYRQILGE